MLSRLNWLERSMRALVVYDSTFGNTAEIARAVAEGLGEGAAAQRVGLTDPLRLGALDLFIVASPTNGGRPTTKMTDFLKRLRPGSLRGMRVAAFDTRMPEADQGLALRTLMRLIGYAAPRIAKALEAAGGRLAVEPAGFVVEGKEGPLRSGELERAVAWGRSLAA